MQSSHSPITNHLVMPAPNDRPRFYDPPSQRPGQQGRLWNGSYIIISQFQLQDAFGAQYYSLAVHPASRTQTGSVRVFEVMRFDQAWSAYEGWRRLGADTATEESALRSAVLRLSAVLPSWESAVIERGWAHARSYWHFRRPDFSEGGNPFLSGYSSSRFSPAPRPLWQVSPSPSPSPRASRNPEQAVAEATRMAGGPQQAYGSPPAPNLGQAGRLVGGPMHQRESALCQPS